MPELKTSKSRPLDAFIRNPETGRVALVQWPNAALGLWILTALVGLLGLFSSHADEIRWIGTGALIAWAADELIRGASPARRLLGLIVLLWEGYQVVSGLVS
jgi:hypothetical protein